MKVIQVHKCFGGWLKRFQHSSASVSCDMKFTVFFPPQASKENPVPYILYLSGLTCTDENFMQKAGAQRYAAECGVALVACDTSPRGVEIPGEDDSYDFGSAAGFYLNATKEPWKGHYKMYDYVVKELPQVLAAELPELDSTKVSIMGHSMGGHGCLTIALKNPDMYTSVSAFAPICNPMNVPWGKKAFKGYLGDDESAWREYDATELAKSYNGPPLDVLIDTGSNDEFLENQLTPKAFEHAAKEKLRLQSNIRDGYDHSYFFIASYIGDHIAFHAERLHKKA